MPSTDPALREAIATVTDRASDDAAWDRLEQVADALQTPDEVMDAYRAALGRGLAREVATRLAERAVRFCQAWYIDTPDAMPALLGLIVERYPDLDWAFERLVVLLTRSAKWSELLTLHDRALAVTRDETKRRALLTDAARLAKDFADEPDRAADYLAQLLRLEPDNDKVVVALERLLERRSRYTELIDLWRGRLAVLSTEEVRAARARIAQISLERLAAPEQALLELRDLIDESPGHPEACQLLERVLALDTAPVVVRREAMMLLRKTYEVVERPAEVVRVLEVGIGFAADDDARALRRELGTRLAILERPAEAMAHYTALLRDAPGDSDARRQLRAIARHHDRTADLIVALTAAGEASDDRAERSSLWLEAADLLATAGRDDDAVDLCRRILAEGEVTESYARRAAHQLSDLLARGQREAERLPIVERLAELERSPSLQRQLLGEAARLAERLNEDERALRNWRKILELDGGDHEALDATIALLDRGGHHRELIAALAQRAGAAVSMEQRRADRVRIAGIEETQLGEPAQAIDSWYAIARDFGYASDVVAALDRLLSATERWPELGEVLEGAVRRERSEAAHHLVRCAKVLATQLGRTDTASELYRQALELDPTDDAASAGLVALLDDPNLGEDAGEALWRAFDRRGQWQRMIDLVEPRLATMGEDRKRAALLADAARLSEQGNDSKAALGFVRRAIAFDPRRRDLRAELLRLAEAENRWVEAAACLREAALAFGEDRGSAAELRREEGRIAEQNLRDYALACDAYRAANELMPSDASSGKGAVRCAARAGRWADAAELIVSVTLLLGQVDDEVLADVELAASLADDAWLLACDALSTTLENGVELDSRLAGRLWGRIAEWHRDQTGDIERAKSAASRSVAAQPDDVETLQRLATLQRSSPSPELADTLLRLDALVGEDSLDALREAAEITSNEDSGVAVLQRLFRKSSELVSSDRPATGIHTASESAAWAMQRLVDRLVSEDRGAQAARLLLRSGEIGLDAEARARAHLRAAELLIAGGDRSLAIDALRRVLADAPDDRTAIARLAELIELEEESSGTIALRHRQVEMTEDREARLALRLTFADRTAKTEEKGACIDWLLQNLAEAPGHGATIDALCRVLDRRSQHKRLAEILEQQADIVRASGQRDQAASLWSRVADVAERNLADAARATAAHERAVAEVPSPRAFDALARLCSMQDQHGDAAKWLQRRLETATAAERTTVMHKLARTQLRAGRESDAIATLRAAFQESPHNAELRKLLLPLLRQREDWGALATTLAASLEHAGDEATVLSYAREAADVYYHKLGAITDAVPVLRRAVALAPEDKRLRAMLADGLRAVGELDEARALLGQLIEDFGRRGSPERAAAHTLMARVLSARGQVSEAMAQLDVASAMAPDDVVILRTLAELAREAGQLERAEAALRTLLLMARRFAAESASAAPIGSAEVLFELSSLAAARGQGEQAAELAESAIEALGESDARLPQLMSGLRERGELALLLRLHDARLGKVLSPFRKGQILGEKAELLERLDRQAEGFDAAMEAIAADPGSPPLHDVARQLATKVGATERYATGLRELLGRTRRDTDGLARCELWLRLGEIESERGAQEAAGRCYDEAAATGVREVDVLRARARAASARGDEREHIRLLQQLANLGEDQVETRADALYRIAEVQLADEASLEEGIEALDKALADTRRPERACMILRRAVERHPSEPRLLAVYERVARDSGDGQLLLGYLERRVQVDEATTEQAREAVTKARELGEADRALLLMKRAVDIARARNEDIAVIDWALIGLAAGAKDRGDIDEAVRWLEVAREAADSDALVTLTREVAEQAALRGLSAVAATLYERLRERDASDPSVWRPLVAIHTESGDLAALERVVRDALDGVHDVAERNRLRIGLANAMLTSDERLEDAVGVLRDATADDPEDSSAAALLADVLERSGKDDDLNDMLRDQLGSALRRGDASAAKAAALKLSRRVPADQLPEIYRDALALGEDAELLQALRAALGPDHDPAERASVAERLLAKSEGAEAAGLAHEAADIYADLGDAASVRRVLESGLGRFPEDERLRTRLEESYRAAGDHAGLVQLLLAAADARAEAPRRAPLLRQAAIITRDELGDSSRSLSLLARARELAPEDNGLAVELAKTIALSSTNAEQLDAMIVEIADPPTKLVLLRMRSSLRAGAGDAAGALEDLEAAYAIDPASAADELVALLDERRIAAADAGDMDGERSATIRSIELMRSHGRVDEGLELLFGLSERMPADVGILRLRRDVEEQQERWEDLARTCELLVDLEQGEEQVTAAMAHFQASRRLGRFDETRALLERVWALHPDDPRMRTAVRRLYEATGAHRELAGVLLLEARVVGDEEEKVSYLKWASEALLGFQDIDGATPALVELVALRPDDAQARCRLADAYMMAGRVEDATALLDGAIADSKRNDPDLHLYIHRRAYLAGATGDHQGRLELLKKAHHAARKNGRIAAELADQAEALEQWELALSTLRTITTTLDDCPISQTQSLVRQARILLRQGDEKKARLCARRAAMADASAEGVQELLAELGEI